MEPTRNYFDSSSAEILCTKTTHSDFMTDRLFASWLWNQIKTGESFEHDNLIPYVTNGQNNHLELSELDEIFYLEFRDIYLSHIQAV